jgi:hypothetical protein
MEISQFSDSKSCGRSIAEQAAGFSRVTSAGELQNILNSLLAAMKSEKQETIKAFQMETAKLSERVKKVG